MKKLRSLLIILMAVLVLAGCDSNSTKNEAKENKKADIEENENKKDNKKDQKDDDKKDDKKDQKDDKKDDNKKDDVVIDADKTLVCNINQDGQEVEVSIGWKKDEINTIGAIVTMDLSGYGIDDTTIDYYQTMMDAAMKEEFGIDDNSKGVDIKSTIDKNTKILTVKIVIDLKNADPSVIEKLNINFTEDDLKHSYEEVKEQAVASGYNCK